MIALSNANHTQIILTTHSPSLVKMLDFDHLKLVQNNGASKEIVNVEKNKLPYPSLNEVNFLAFYEGNEEYHNELYGFIEHEDWLNEYQSGKSKMEYNKVKNGSIVAQKIILSEYIRHQIHHPENTHNTKYTYEQLSQSIQEMRTFIESKRINTNQSVAA